MIAPGIFRHKNTINLSDSCQKLFIGMIIEADDYGYGDADCTALLCAHWPRSRDVSVEDVEKWRADLCQAGLIELDPDAKYYKLTGWDDHQKLRADYVRDDTHRLKFKSVTDPIQDRNGPVTDPLRTRNTSKVSKVSKVSKEKESARKKPRALSEKKNPQFQNFVDWWFQAYESAYQQKYSWTAVDGKQLKTQLTRIGFDELKARCQAVLDGNALTWMERPVSFLKIVGQINDIKTRAGKAGHYAALGRSLGEN